MKNYLVGLLMLTSLSASTLGSTYTAFNSRHQTLHLKGFTNRRVKLKTAPQDKYKLIGGYMITDSIYQLEFSVKTIKEILNLMKTQKTNPYFWYDVYLPGSIGPTWWVYRNNFYNDLQDFDDWGSIFDVIHDTQTHIYSGKGFGKFNLSSFKANLQKAAVAHRQNLGMGLEFYRDYRFLAHNKYGAKWYLIDWT